MGRPAPYGRTLRTRRVFTYKPAAAVGIKRTSIRSALESLVANADVIEDGGKPRLTDPMFEYWLWRRGLTPLAGNDDEDLG